MEKKKNALVDQQTNWFMEDGWRDQSLELTQIFSFITLDRIALR